MSLPLLLYALYCAYRDRHKTRARRNPYSRRDMFVDCYATNNRDAGFSLSQMYANRVAESRLELRSPASS